MKGINFEGLRDAGDPAELAAPLRRRRYDELTVLHITATVEERQRLLDTDPPLSQRAFPCRSASAAASGPRTTRGRCRRRRGQGEPEHRGTRTTWRSSPHSRKRYGSQAVIVAIDAKRPTGVRPSIGRSAGETRENAVDWAREADRPRRRRDPAYLDRSRRHEERLRLRTDRRGLGCRDISRDSLRWRRRSDHFAAVFT